MLKRRAVAMAAVCTVLLGAGSIGGALAAGPRVDVARGTHLVRWVPCPGQPVTVECTRIWVPLNYAEPNATKIRIALTRVRGSAPRRDPLLVNPGGPGASGLTMARIVARALPPRLAERYDVIGFDPRGVGAGFPTLSCVEAADYYRPPRPDYVPANPAEERNLVQRAINFATSCAYRAGWLLPHLNTVNQVRDIDQIRVALGARRISFLGYSYGSYLGAAYATMFPRRVHRMVLDSVLDPTRVWYRANIDQNYGFNRRHKDFLTWVARHNRIYRLGTNPARIEWAWYATRSRLRARPAEGVIGPAEFDDLYMIGAYDSYVWPGLAQAFSAYVHKGEGDQLVAEWQDLAAMDDKDENEYANYLAVECGEATWPRDWARWHADAVRVYRDAPFLTWNNTWYNAPCAFWSARGPAAPRVGSRQTPPILLVQAERDGATPLGGALVMRRLLPNSRLILEADGGDHGVSLSGNHCVDRYVFAYLSAGKVPQARRPVDAACPRRPDPIPRQAMRHATHPRVTELLRGR